MIKKAIIGGTGVYHLDGEHTVKDVKTSYGTVTVYIQTVGDKKIAFLPRHGKGHSAPPHRINYRANIKALKQLGAEQILATAAVGSLNTDYPPGSFVILEQFIDFTKQRASTFYDGKDGVIHADMAAPYCPALIKAMEQRTVETGIEILGRGTYICVEGPRFETEAEIKFFSHIGGDIVGMTSVPEVILARELGMCYAAVGIVTNWCNGIVEKNISHREIIDIMEKGRVGVVELFLELFRSGAALDKCNCSAGLIKL